VNAALRSLTLASLLIASACSSKTPELVLGGDTGTETDSATTPPSDSGATDTGPTAPPDADADGYDETIDCDDADPTVSPGADEVCDGIDNDCDGTVDNHDSLDAATWHADADEDGYGAPDDTVTACDQPEGHTPAGGPEDCDDATPSVHPDAEETCNGVDDDCDTTIDEEATDFTTFYADSDEDGEGDPASPLDACELPGGYTTDATDCDDTDASQNTADVDADGFSTCAGDCDDSAFTGPAAFPGAGELCDDVDQDCDTIVDEEAADFDIFYADTDGDGFGDPDTHVDACHLPEGYVVNNQDCDDAPPIGASVNPDGLELCGGADEDCDGVVDEDGAEDARRWFQDADDDGHGDAEDAGLTACDNPSTGAPTYVLGSDDCDDGDETVSPSASEICDNGVDDDCDTLPGDCELSGSLQGEEADVRIEGGSFYGILGRDVATGGDLDGDGDDDLLLSLNSLFDADAPGTWLLFDGPLSAGGYTQDDADLALETAADAGTGTSASAWCGDLDGDGVEDAILADAFSNDGIADGGAAYMIYGPLLDVALTDQADAIFGETPDAVFGGSAACGGDVDGDGEGDILLGSYQYIPDDVTSADYSVGLVHLVLGPLAAGSGDAAIGAVAEASFFGVSASDRAGYSLDFVDDLDGDGDDELLIGAYGVEDGAGVDNAGEAYLFRGPVSGDYDVDAADVIFTGLDGGDHLGSAVASVGDINGDGEPDLAISARHVDAGDGGAVFLFFGPIDDGEHDVMDADVILSGELDGERFGDTIGRPGDVNGDGHDDLLIGATDRAVSPTGDVLGGAYLFYGPITEDRGVSEADFTFYGRSSYGYAGSALDAGADLNGDGYDDLVISEPYDDDGDPATAFRGVTWVLFGGGI